MILPFLAGRPITVTYELQFTDGTSYQDRVTLVANKPMAIFIVGRQPEEVKMLFLTYDDKTYEYPFSIIFGRPNRFEEVRVANGDFWTDMLRRKAMEMDNG